MDLRKLSDFCLLVLLAAAGSPLRFPERHQTGADAPLTTPVRTPTNGVPASKDSLRKPAPPRGLKPAIGTATSTITP